MNIQNVLNSIPHRYPFILVDRVLSFEPFKYIEALKNVTINEPFFQGHFPISPVMPGVLIIESMAQAAAILACKSTGWRADESLFYLAGIEHARFKKVVIPGDQLVIRIDVDKHRHHIWKVKGQAKVAGEVVCTVELTSAEGKVV